LPPSTCRAGRRPAAAAVKCVAGQTQRSRPEEKRFAALRARGTVRGQHTAARAE
jgi:hypothetical protein